MASPTPEPWKAIGCVVRATGIFSADLSFRPNLSRPVSEDELEANARLIAAAPDLLDALLTALPYVEMLEGDEHYKPGAVAKTLKKMRAAIAKADGAE